MQNNKPKLEKTLLKWDMIGRYSKWLYSLLKPYVGKRVIDIGVGVGNMMQFYIDQTDFAIGTDIFDSQLDIVKNRFGDKVSIMVLDIEKDDVSVLLSLGLDTVICINVLEHIENDLIAIQKMGEIIKPKGTICILVPAGSKLYNHMDKSSGHFRRYDKGRLRSLAEQTGMKVIKNHYFNMFGIIPYYLKGVFSKGKEGTFSSDLNDINSRFYNVASSVLEPFEKIVKIPIGLSEFIVLEKG